MASSEEPFKELSLEHNDELDLFPPLFKDDF